MVFKVPIYRISNEIRDKTCVRWPVKLGDAQRQFNLKFRYTFHFERGHKTEDCLALRQHLKELVAAGHLDRYINDEVRLAAQEQAIPDSRANDDAPQGVINVIHGIVALERVCELRKMIKKAEHMRKMLVVQPVEKKVWIEQKNVISFSSKNLERIQTPQNDALVVTMRIESFDIKTILIDQGNFVVIMYYDAFKQLKLKNEDLAPTTSPLVGLTRNQSGHCVPWNDSIALFVHAGSV